MMDQQSYTIRTMELKDIDKVVFIERQSFPVPWTRDAFEKELTQNHFSDYIVLQHEEEVIGYCGLWIIVDEAHITNIAILPEYRGKHLGEKLLSYVCKHVKENGCVSITLEARISNKVAQNLYQKLNFQYGGIRKNYYTDNLEDAIVMWRDLT